eukprot:1591030-Amphidinium_carterae.1
MRVFPAMWAEYDSFNFLTEFRFVHAAGNGSEVGVRALLPSVRRSVLQVSGFQPQRGWKVLLVLPRQAL